MGILSSMGLNHNFNEYYCTAWANTQVIKIRGNEARKRWAEYFEDLLNVQEDREADIVAVGGVQVPVMGEEKEKLQWRR